MYRAVLVQNYRSSSRKSVPAAWSAPYSSHTRYEDTSEASRAQELQYIYSMDVALDVDDARAEASRRVLLRRRVVVLAALALAGLCLVAGIFLGRVSIGCAATRHHEPPAVDPAPLPPILLWRLQLVGLKILKVRHRLLNLILKRLKEELLLHQKMMRLKKKLWSLCLRSTSQSH